MADQNVALKALKDIEDGIDYIVNLTQMFVDPTANTLRVHLFNAKQISVQMQSSVQPGAAAESEVIAGTAASGTTAAANVAGTGGEATSIAAVPIIPVEPDRPKPEGIDQATWDAMDLSARTAVFASLGTAAPADAVSPRALPQEPSPAAPAAPAPEDQAAPQTPPWAGQEPAPTA